MPADADAFEAVLIERWRATDAGGPSELADARILRAARAPMDAADPAAPTNPWLRLSAAASLAAAVGLGLLLWSAEGPPSELVPSVRDAPASAPARTAPPPSASADAVAAEIAPPPEPAAAPAAAPDSGPAAGAGSFARVAEPRAAESRVADPRGDAAPKRAVGSLDARSAREALRLQSSGEAEAFRVLADEGVEEAIATGARLDASASVEGRLVQRQGVWLLVTEERALRLSLDGLDARDRQALEAGTRVRARGAMLGDAFEVLQLEPVAGAAARAEQR